MMEVEGMRNEMRGESLVFVHGAGSSADFWHLQRKAFPRARFVNLPGHGREGTADEGLQVRGGGGEGLIARYAEWVGEYVERERLSRVVLNGHSMGGAVALEVALEVALRRPAWLRGLVLTSTGARFLIGEGLLKLLRDDYEGAVDFIMAESFGWEEGALSYAQKVRRNGTRKQMLRTPQEVTLADYEGCVGFDVRGRLGEIDVPTLIVVGAQDRVTPPFLSRELNEGIAGSRLETVEGGGHMLPMEREGEYDAVLRGFVGEVTGDQ